MKPTDIKTRHWLKYNLLFFIEHFLGRKLFDKLFSGSLQRLYRDIDAYLKDSNRGVSLDVASIEMDPLAEDVRKPVYTPNLPKVFRKAAVDWTSTKKWDLDFFEKHFGELDVMLNDNVGFVDHKNPQKFEVIKLKKYIQLMREGSMKYLKFSNLVHTEKNLQEDLNLSWLGKFQRSSSFGTRFFLFIGGKGTFTPIHNAIPVTVFIQISGKKKWTIFPTEERLFLGVRPERRPYFYTPADPYITDDPNFPLMKYVKKYEVTLEPGDVLWMPPYVWHQVENPTDSIGVAYKFVDFPEAFKSTKMLSTLFFLATKPTLLATLWVSITSKVDILFSRKQEDVDKIY